MKIYGEIKPIKGALHDVDTNVPSRTFRFAPLYSGGPAQIDGWEGDVYIDVATLKIDDAPRALVEHNLSECVGRLENIEKRIDENTGRLGVYCDAVIGGCAAAQKIVDANAVVDRWAPSIGAYRIHESDVKHYDDCSKVVINGAYGEPYPGYVVYNATLCEGSFVWVPGDAGARAFLAKIGSPMDKKREEEARFDEYLLRKGFKREDMADDELEKARRDFEEFAGRTGFACGDDPEKKATAEAAEIADEAVKKALENIPEEDAKALDEAVLKEVAEEIADEMESGDILAEAEKADEKATMKIKRIINSAKANIGGAYASNREEDRRVAAIKTLCADFGRDGARVAAKAIEKGWSVKRTDAILRAEAEKKQMNRSSQVIASVGLGQRADGLDADGRPLREKVLAVALALNCGMSQDRAKRAFKVDDRVINEAVSGKNRGMSIRPIIAECCNSYKPYSYDMTTTPLAGFNMMKQACASAATIRALGPRVAANLGFTTISAIDIFELVLQAFMEPREDVAPPVYREITKEYVMRDFNQARSFLATMTGRLQQISTTGQLEHVGFTTKEFTHQTAPMGAVFTIPEQTFIDDQLGAYADLLAQLNELPDYSVEHDVAKAFWGLINGDTTTQIDGQTVPFVSAANGNLISGAGSALDENGVTAAVTALNSFKNANGLPLRADGSILLTGSATHAAAQRLYTSEYLYPFGQGGVNNIYRNVYKPKLWQWLDAAHSAEFKADGTTPSVTQTYKDSLWILLRDPQRRPAVVVNKMAGFESPQVKRFDTDPNVWGFTYQLIYPYSVDVQYVDSMVVSYGA